ncbi:PAS domain-containing protein [Clostridium botulinum]|nr:PAS domain-containing protein [Clostridium botulinum]
MGILDTIHEGLVAVDYMGRITLINNSALKILNLQHKVDKDEVIGKNIENIIENTGMINILQTGESEFEREQKINNTTIMTNRIPIMKREKIVGAIASFRDKTEVTRMAEELTGAKKWHGL